MRTFILHILVFRVHEHLHQAGVELRAGALLQLCHRLRMRPRRAIGPVGGHRVVGIGYGDDARGKGDLLARQTVGIAIAIPSFVVMVDPGNDALQGFNRLDNLRAVVGMEMNRVSLVRGEWFHLAQDFIWDGDLAHVVQERSELQLARFAIMCYN